MVKKIRGGTTQKTEENGIGEWILWFFTLIAKIVIFIIIFILVMIILFAGLSVVLMFIGSYIMLEYFLKMINYIVKGLNKIIKPIVGGFKKVGVKIKGGKIDKVPTDPSQLVLKALGLPSFKDDDDDKADNVEDEECTDE
jgi:hypothetical protein